LQVLTGTGSGEGEVSAGRRDAVVTNVDSSARAWWDWHLFGLWVLVNGLAFVVVPLAGVAVQQLASVATRNLVQDHRGLVVLIIAVIGAVLQGLVVGSWQWRLLRRRVPDLRRRRWVMATLVPAFAVWLLVIAPQAADVLARGGMTLILFREGFIQALVLGPLIGLSQAAALRGHSSRWAWWVRRERDHLSQRRSVARIGCLAETRMVPSRADDHVFPGGGVRDPRGVDALGDRTTDDEPPGTHPGRPPAVTQTHRSPGQPQAH
jgi:hypothetical protein